MHRSEKIRSEWEKGNYQQDLALYFTSQIFDTLLPI